MHEINTSGTRWSTPVHDVLVNSPSSVRSFYSQLSSSIRSQMFNRIRSIYMPYLHLCVCVYCVRLIDAHLTEENTKTIFFFSSLFFLHGCLHLVCTVVPLFIVYVLQMKFHTHISRCSDEKLEIYCRICKVMVCVCGCCCHCCSCVNVIWLMR